MTNNIDEGSLLKNIKHTILKKWLGGDTEATNICNILPMAAAIIYPHRNAITVCTDIDIIKKRGSISEILDSVQRFCKKNGPRLDTYSYDALIKCFREEWFSNLTLEQKRKLCGGISIIVSVEDSGYVAFRGNEKVWNTIVSLGSDDLDAVYGCVDYVPIEVKPSSKPVSVRQVQVQRQPTVSTDDADRALNVFWINSIKTNTFDVDMPYVWKLKISQDDYNELKSLLVETCSRYGSKRQDFIERHAEKMLVYVAEWYRREYDARGNALREISSHITAKDIFESIQCKKWQTHLYSGEINDCWLYSMYVLGGLPIKYAPYGITLIYDRIFDAINGDADALNSEPSLNNTAFKESLMNEDGSLRAFVDSIVNGDLPFSERDLELDDVKSFIARINEGHKRSRLKKFRLEWIVNYDGSSDYGERRLRILFNPEIPGDLHGYISYNRMSKSWGVNNAEDLTSFKIKCRINDGDPFLVAHFSNQWNGYFAGWTTENYVDIPRANLPATYITKIDLLLCHASEGGRESVQIIQTDQYETPYIQLYPTDEICEWSNMVRTGNKSAVAFRMPLFADDSSELQFDDNNDIADRYGWKEFVDNCLLKDIDGTIYPLKRKGNSIEITPRLKHETISYHKGLVKHVNQSKETYLPLILGKDGLVVKRYEFDKEEPDILDKKEYQLEYKMLGSSRYEDFVNPPQGLMTIRATHNEQVAKLDVYYLPSSYNDAVKRNLSSHEIRFDKSIRDVYNERVGELNGIFLDINYSDNIDQSDPFNKYLDVIFFRIGSSEEYVELPVYRPYVRKVLSFNGKPIYVTENKDKVFSVAMINSDRMSVHTIDEHGKKIFPKQNVGFCDFDEEISWINNNTNLVINNGNIKYNICDDNKSWGLNNGRIHVSREFRDQYKFFFWPVNKWSEPKEIETQYNTDSEMLEIDKKYLSETGILFQSLYGLTPPRYWKPVITHANRYTEFSSDVKTQIKCFDIAVKHGIYFKIFEPLYRIIPVTGGLQDLSIVEFFFEYAKSKDNKLTDEEYNGLYRFADEFMFDWLFLARSEWIMKTKTKEEKKLAAELFRKNPKIKNKSVLEQAAYTKIVDTYWSGNYPSRTDEKWKPNGYKLEAKAIKYMNSFLGKYKFTGSNRSYNVSKTFLHDLYEKENSFQLIFNKIKDELFK